MQRLLIFSELLDILLISACKSVSGYRVIFYESVDIKKNVRKSLVSACLGNYSLGHNILELYNVLI